jgi:hypothetical protein
MVFFKSTGFFAEKYYVLSDLVPGCKITHTFVVVLLAAGEVE